MDIAVFSFPVTAFPVGKAFREYPELTIELERIVPTDEEPLSFFWARGTNAGRLEAVLDNHSAFDSITLLETLDTEALYQLVWAGQPPDLVQGLLQHDLTLLSGIGTEDGWNLQVRAPDTETLNEFTNYCEQYDITLTLERMYTVAETRRPSDYNVTDEQYEALALAYEEGYFEHPRQISLEELAEIVGITRQSFAERLRRGHKNLIENTVWTGIE